MFPSYKKFQAYTLLRIKNGFAGPKTFPCYQERPVNICFFRGLVDIIQEAYMTWLMPCLMRGGTGAEPVSAVFKAEVKRSLFV